MRFEKRNNCYFAERDGFVRFFYYKKPGDGYDGGHFHLKMKDGSEETLIGPWSSRSSVMNQEGFTPCKEAAITDDPEVWDRGHIFFSLAVTIEIVEEALKLIPGTELRKKTDENGEIHYCIREIGKSLKETKTEKKIINPNRVIVGKGRAIPARKAKAQFGIEPDIIFIRDDGWTLGAPSQFEKEAYETWKDHWTHFVRPGISDAKSRPIEHYRP